MNKNNSVKEAIVFLVMTLALSYFVFWGPLVVFKIPAASFVKDVYPASCLGISIIYNWRVCSIACRSWIYLVI